MGKKRKKQKQKQKQKISKAASSSGSGSSINTKNPLYYWDGVEFPKELQDEYKKALEQLKEGQYQALNLEKLHAHNGDERDYWSIRTTQKGRLIFTTEFIEGKRVLVFVKALPNHEYDKWERSLPAVPKPFSISDQQEVQPLSAEEVQFKDMLQTVDTTQVTALKSYQGKFILLSPIQNGVVEIDGPCIVNGVAGSGKTSSALFLLSRWIEKKPHGEVIYISSSTALVKCMAEEFKAAQAEEEKCKEEKGKENGKEEKKIQFKTYAEWLCTTGGHKKLKSRKDILEDFEKWLKDYSQAYKEKYRNQEKAQNRLKNKGYHSSSSLSLSFFTHADAPELRFLDMDATQLYHEFRKISNEEDYVKKGMGSFIAQGEEQQALRAAIYAAYKACPDSIKEESEDFANLQEQSKDEQAITLVLIDEAQDLSKKQIENIIQWSAARGLRIVFFRDSLQSVRDASSNYHTIKNCFFKVQENPSLRQQEIKEINLPISYRSFPAAKPWVDGWLKIRSKLTGKMDKTEIAQLDVKVNEHSAPGSVHWIIDIDAKKQALFDAGCESPSFAIVAPKEYLEEAKRRFNTKLVLTPEEIKGRQFKVVLVYRPFSRDVFKDANKILEQYGRKSFDKKHNESNDLITNCNETFVSLTRANSQMIIYQPREHGINALVNSLTENKAADLNADFSLLLEEVDASEEKWLQESKRQLRYGYIEKAEEIIVYHVKKEELKKEFTEFKMDYVEAQKEPSYSVPKQEELNQKKPKGKEKEETMSPPLKDLNCVDQFESSLRPRKLSEKEAADSIYAQVKEKGENFLPSLRGLAQEGNIYAQYHLYSLYSHNPSLRKDNTDAFSWCYEAAEGGHPQAQYWMANEYSFRAKRLRELPKQTENEKRTNEERALADEKIAFSWCLKAAKSDEPMAQHFLSIMYVHGKGVQSNMEAAFGWCFRSATQGCAMAQHSLAMLYYLGQGTERDLERAEQWCYKAIAQWDGKPEESKKSEDLLQAIKTEQLSESVFARILTRSRS